MRILQKKYRSNLNKHKPTLRANNEYDGGEANSPVKDNQSFLRPKNIQMDKLPTKTSEYNNVVSPHISKNFRPHIREKIVNIDGDSPRSFKTNGISLGIPLQDFRDNNIMPIVKRLDFFENYDKKNSINVHINNHYNITTDFTIVIPYKYETRDNSIIYCLRSIEKYMAGNYNIILVGDEYDGIDKEKIIYIPLKSKLKYKELRTLEAKLTAFNHPHCAPQILLADDDLYLTKNAHLNDFIIPRTYNKEIAVNGSTSWGQYKINTKKLLKDKNLPCKEYGIHSYYYYERGKFMKLFKVFPEIYYIPVLIEDLYYNYYNTLNFNYSTDWDKNFQFRVQNHKKKYTQEEFYKRIKNSLFLNNDGNSYNGYVIEYLQNEFGL